MWISTSNPFFNYDGENYHSGGSFKFFKLSIPLDCATWFSDGAPLIYTPKEDGVKPEFDIRTDKWQIAINAMDRVNAYKLSDYTKNGRNPEMRETEKEGETKTGETTNTGDNSAA